MKYFVIDFSVFFEIIVLRDKIKDNITIIKAQGNQPAKIIVCSIPITPTRSSFLKLQS